MKSAKIPTRRPFILLILALVLTTPLGYAQDSELAKRGFNLDNLQVDPENLLSGGPPKDGIPALSDPETISVEQADFMQPDDRVVGVSLNGENRAYPLRLLNWHEVINDSIGGVPVVVVYCPLCDSASVMDRRIGGETLEFGVSGLLMSSNVILYDRTHNALWSQVALKALSGPYAGRSLDHLKFSVGPFEAWRTRSPQSTVATFETGHRRDYSHNPYDDYFESPRIWFPLTHDDDRLPDKARVVGIKLKDAAMAYPLDRLARSPTGRISDELLGQKVVLKYENNQIQLVEVPPQAEVVHTFWFAWAAFHPDTRIYESD